MFFSDSPSDIGGEAPPSAHRLPAWRLVAEGSVQQLRREREFCGHRTLRKKPCRLPTYRGLRPDLFRGRAGVVAEGVLTEGGGTLPRNNVLAKHDEN
jgi:cytochrome c-type biogenesis protein CcmE